VKGITKLLLGLSIPAILASYSDRVCADSIQALANMEPETEVYNPPKKLPKRVEHTSIFEEQETDVSPFAHSQAQDLMDGPNNISIPIGQQVVPGVESRPLEDIISDRPLSTNPTITLKPTYIPDEPVAEDVIDVQTSEISYESETSGKKGIQEVEFQRPQTPPSTVAHHSNPAVSYKSPQKLGLVPIPFNLDDVDMEFKEGAVSTSFKASTDIRQGLRSEHLASAFGKTSWETGTVTKYDIDGSLSRSQSIMLTDMDKLAAEEAALEKARVKAIIAQGASAYYAYMAQEKPPTFADLIKMTVDNNLGLGEVQSITRNYGGSHGKASFGLRETEVRDLDGLMAQRQFVNAAYQGIGRFNQSEDHTSIFVGPNDEFNIERGFLGLSPTKERREGTILQLNLKQGKARMMTDQFEQIYEAAQGEPGVGWSAFHRIALGSTTTKLSFRGIDFGILDDSSGERYIVNVGPMNSKLGFGRDYKLIDIGAEDSWSLGFEENGVLDTSRLAFAASDKVEFRSTKSGVNHDLTISSQQLKNTTYTAKTVAGVRSESLLLPNYGVSLFRNPGASGIQYINPDESGDILRIENVVSTDPNVAGNQLIVTAKHHEVPWGLVTGDQTRLLYAKDGISFVYDGKFSAIEGERDLSHYLGFNSEGHLIVGMSHTPQVGQTGVVQTNFGPFTGEMHLSMSGLSDMQFIKWIAKVEKDWWSFGAIQALNQEPGLTARMYVPVNDRGGILMNALYQLDNPQAGGEHSVEITLVGKYSGSGW